MSTAEKLLWEKVLLAVRLREEPRTNQREQIESRLAEIDHALNVLELEPRFRTN